MPGRHDIDDDLIRQFQAGRLPPRGDRDPAAPCGDFGIRIDRDGTWYYRGSPITRKPLVKLFATVLRREEDGTYWLVTPVERGRIVVDDAPFTAIGLEARGDGDERVLRFVTNLDEVVEAGPEHPIRVDHDPATGEPSPYVLVRPGLEALIVRPVFYELAELAEERELDGRRVLGVSSGGRFFALGPAEDAA